MNKLNKLYKNQANEILKLVNTVVRTNYLKIEKGIREGGLITMVMNELDSSFKRSKHEMLFKQYTKDNWNVISQAFNISLDQRMIQKVIFTIIDATHYFTSENYISSKITNGYPEIIITPKQILTKYKKANMIPYLAMWKQMSYINGNPLYDLGLDESIFTLDGYSIPTYIYKIKGFDSTIQIKSDQQSLPMAKSEHKKIMNQSKW